MKKKKRKVRPKKNKRMGILNSYIMTRKINNKGQCLNRHSLIYMIAWTYLKREKFWQKTINGFAINVKSISKLLKKWRYIEHPFI